VGVEFKGVRRSRKASRAGIESEECAERDDRREMIKSSRNGVHRADAVVRGLV
jgi:hypothetical protein